MRRGIDASQLGANTVAEIHIEGSPGPEGTTGPSIEPNIEPNTEPNTERKSFKVLPWIAGLVLLMLAIWGLSKMAPNAEAAAPGHRAPAADTLQDKTPPRLRQYALAPGIRAEEPALSRAAA
jgi:hypothetical protein